MSGAGLEGNALYFPFSFAVNLHLLYEIKTVKNKNCTARGKGGNVHQSGGKPRAPASQYIGFTECYIKLLSRALAANRVPVEDTIQRAEETCEHASEKGKVNLVLIN